MTCPRSGRLRAYLDGELSTSQREALDAHLATCERCQQRLCQARELAAETQARMCQILPRDGLDGSISGADRALASVKRRVQMHDTSWRDRIMGDRMKRWRPALIGVGLMVLFVSLYLYSPTQAVARQFLSMFRVRRFAVVRVNPDQNQMEQVGRALEDTLFVGDPEIVVDGAETEVDSIGAARELAGFDARVPAFLPNSEPIEIGFKGYSESVFRFTRQGLQLFLDMAEMGVQVPDTWEEGDLRVSFASMVVIEQPNLQIVQALNPMLEYPEGIDPGVIGEAGLRLLGVSPEEARRISATIDWSSTLVLPIPTDIGTFTELEIAGSQAVYVRASDRNDQFRSTLMWEKDGVVTVVAGRASNEDTVKIAESMYN